MDNRLNNIFNNTFGTYGWQYFNKLLKSFIAISKDIIYFCFMESIKQRQVAKTIQIAMSEIVQKDIGTLLEGAMVTISGVRVTPDLYVARIYLSIYNHPKPDEILDHLDKNNKLIRGLLGNKIKNKVRSIPQVEFFRDETLEEVQNLERIFSEIKKKDAEMEKLRKNNDKIG